MRDKWEGGGVSSAGGPSVLVLRSLGEGGCSAKVPVEKRAGGRACYVKIKSFVEKNVFAQKKWKFVLAGECFSLPKAQRQE